MRLREEGVLEALRMMIGRDRMVLAAAFFLAWWRLCSLSVWTGQDALMVKLAWIRAVARESQAATSLCVNMTVITPSSRRTRWASWNAAAILRS